MLRFPDHQVAGHQGRDGQLGPQIDGSGLFYKPLQSDDRGSNELKFYSSFSSDPRVPPSLRRRFFPSFHGTQLLPSPLSPSSLHPHLVLDDLISPLSSPSIIDLKIGARTWFPSAPTAYLEKCLKKDLETTSSSLGFRISGLQIHQGENLGYWKPDKNEVKSFTVKDVRRVLRRFVSTNPCSDPDPDCALASAVFGGSDGVLAKLLELKAWFEDQTMYHFCSASVLVVYEKGGAEAARVKLVDFAHVLEGDGVIDHNFLGGLCSLIKFVSEILTDPDECGSKAAQLAVVDGG